MIQFLNKRNIFILFTIYYLLLTILLIPSISFAEECDRSQTAVCSIADVLKILNNIVGWMYRIFFIVAALFIILAAYNYLTTQGNPETIQKVNKQIFYAVIAIIIAIVSVGFDVIIRTFLEQGK